MSEDGYFNSQPHKEADFFSLCLFPTYCKFQLTASQGGWRCYNLLVEYLMLFQLTASQGGWRHEHTRFFRFSCISTHSLTRRLTTINSLVWFSDIFQLTASQGGWRGWAMEHKKIELFQLTASQGGWRSWSERLIRELYFNSQPHKEADTRNRRCNYGIIHFNSQPHKEADLKIWRKNAWKRYFNSQPHKEADVDIRFFVSKHRIFQLTASQGGWPSNDNRPDPADEFQLTASQGGWLLRQARFQRLPIFQLTASQGGWPDDSNHQPYRWAFQLTASQGGWLRT